MNAKMMTQYIEFVGDRLCLQLGIDKIYGSVNPLDFMELIKVCLPMVGIMNVIIASELEWNVLILSEEFSKQSVSLEQFNGVLFSIWVMAGWSGIILFLADRVDVQDDIYNLK